MAAYVFGIDDDNNIWEINPEAKTTTLIHNTGLTTKNGSNGVGYDQTSDNILFFYDNSLYSWKRNSRETVRKHEINANAGNAAGHAGSLWYINGTNLKRINLQSLQDNGTLTNNDISTYQLSESGYPGGGFGDIAISQDGILYGSRTGTGNNSGLFSIDISGIINGSSTEGFNYHKLANIAVAGKT